MSLTILTAIILAISFTLSLAETPLALGLWILIIALFIAIILRLSVSSWFGFILFLIYVGGLLVIFAYFVAISPNQQLQVIKLFWIIIFTSRIIIFTQKSFFWSAGNINTRTLLSLTNIHIINPINTAPLAILGLILFLALIAVVKISYHSKGPLRPYQ